MRHLVIILGDGGRAEGVGFDEIGACRQVLFVNFLNDTRLGQRQQFIVALDEQFPATGCPMLLATATTIATGAKRPLKIGKAFAAIIRLGQLVTLDHGAHGTIQHHDATRKNLAQGDFRG